MPIFDQGYTHWKGEIGSFAWRWTAVARRGILAQLRGKWIRMAMVMAAFPALILVGALVIWALIEQNFPIPTFLRESFLNALGQSSNLQELRVTVWTHCFYYFLGFQFYFCLLLTLMVGQDLISQDLRFNALPLYLSRPLRRIDYFLGKFGVVAAFLSVTMVGPLLAAYVLGVAFSLDITVIRDTWRLLLGCFFCCGIVILSMGTLILAMSSLSRNSRYVGMMWFGLLMVSSFVAGSLDELLKEDWCLTISYTGNLMRTRDMVLDLEGSWPANLRAKRQLAVEEMRASMKQHQFRPNRRTMQMVDPPKIPWQWTIGILAGMSGLSLCILSFRVRSLDRLK